MKGGKIEYSPPAIARRQATWLIVGRLQLGVDICIAICVLTLIGLSTSNPKSTPEKLDSIFVLALSLFWVLGMGSRAEPCRRPRFIH
jgi:hypothetical protein